MLVQLIRDRVSVARPFIFLRMCGSHEGFIPLMQAIWNTSVEGCAMVCIRRKLQLLKHAQRTWSQDVFCHVELELKKLEDGIIRMELCLSDNYSSQTE